MSNENEIPWQKIIKAIVKLAMRRYSWLDPEEVESEVMVCVVKANTLYDPKFKAKPTTWLINKGYWLLIDALRQQHKISYPGGIPSKQIINATDMKESYNIVNLPCPEQQHQDPEMERIAQLFEGVRLNFDTLVGCCDEREQSILRMKYEDDLSFQVIADRLGISEAGAWYLHNRAKEKVLAEILRVRQDAHSDQATACCL